MILGLQPSIDGLVVIFWAFNLFPWLVSVQNSYLRRQRNHRDSKERDPQEVSEWKQHAWSMCCWSTLTTGLGAGIGTFIAPGVGSAVGRLVGMNIIYLTASEPQWRD